MRVLVACEFSGVVREAFRRRGHDAWSCDILPAEDGSPYHIEGDVELLLDVAPDWDLMIAHPPCTFLANSGVKHLYVGGRKENGLNHPRWHDMWKAVDFYRMLRAAPVARKAIENPVWHRYAMERLGGERHFVQPWWFGERELKATGWELHGLPPLVATDRLEPPRDVIERRKWARVHRESPSPDRWKNRSRFLRGMADAMAEQWGGSTC